MQTGVIEAVSEKQVNTRRGPAKAYSVKVNGNWMSAGFKEPPVKGTEIQFDVVTNAKGYTNVENIVPISAPGASTMPSSSTRLSAGNWPIPKDSGRDRSIMRQNAVTNALRFLELRVNDAGEQVMDTATVIAVARDFEAYYSGDLDVAESKAFDDVLKQHNED